MARKPKKNYEDLNHLARLRTHSAAGGCVPRIRQGSIVKTSKGSTKFVPAIEPTRPLVVGQKERKSHDRLAVQSMHVKRRLKKVGSWLAGFMGQEVSMYEISEVTSNVCSPDIPVEDRYPFI